MSKRTCCKCGKKYDYDEVNHAFLWEFNREYEDMMDHEDVCLECAREIMEDYDDGPQKQYCCEGCWGKWPECASTCLQYDPV